MKKRIAGAAAVLGAALSMTAAPAHAGSPGTVAKYEFNHVYQWDEKFHVEQVLDRSGHHVTHWVDPEGTLFTQRAYPTTVDGGQAFVTFIHYRYGVALWSKKWCVPDGVGGLTCSATP